MNLKTMQRQAIPKAIMMHGALQSAVNTAER